MRGADTLRFATQSLGGHPLRSGLIVLAMAIGVAGVIVLTGLASAAREYVTQEFRALGTDLLVILPGRSETTGAAPPMLGESARDLTIDDALALLRIPTVRRVAPIVAGDAPVAHGGRAFEATILGTTADYFEMRRLSLAAGRAWRLRDVHDADPVCIVGRTVERQLFDGRSALGEWVRISGWRFRVVGVVASEGRSFGVDIDDVVAVPVGSALALFDTPALFRVLVEATDREHVPDAQRAVEASIRRRHEGELDVTVIAQESVLSTFDTIFDALTYSVAGIASISMLVAGVLVMNVMVVAVSQRREEIGLLKALGAPPRQIRAVFLAEATLLSLGGAFAGIGLGEAALAVGERVYPDLSGQPPLWALGAAVGIPVLCGLVFGVAPARRAARLDPVMALARR